jgi:hypothetical protein
MVSLSGSYLTNVQGVLIPIGIQNMTFRVVACPDADLNGSINVLDAYQTALQWGDRGRDCGVTLSSAATNNTTTLEINDQSLAWWRSTPTFGCTGSSDGTRPNQVSVDAEIMTAGAFSEGSPDTVAVTRGVNSTIAKSHLAGAAVYLIPSQWDGNYDGKNGYTATRDVDHNGTINLLDTLVIVNVMGMQCP